MLDLHFAAQGKTLPIFALPTILGRAGAYEQIGDAIEGLIAFADELAGDADLEENGDLEPDGDWLGDVSWTEWHTRGRRKIAGFGAEPTLRRDGSGAAREDDEDDDPDTGVEDDPRGFDPEEDRCLAGDDMVLAGPVFDRGYWHTQDRSWYPRGHGIGSEDDAEANGDHELNGDEGDHTPGAPWE